MKMQQHLEGKISGADIVRAIDDFVANDHVYRLPEEICKRVLSLQDNVAFYVESPVERKEYPAYFGGEKLKEIVFLFLKGYI